MTKSISKNDKVPFFVRARKFLLGRPASNAPENQIILAQQAQTIAQQSSEISTLKKEVSEAFSLAAQQEDLRYNTEVELAQVKKELESAQEQLQRLPSVNLIGTKAIFPDLSNLTLWAEAHFPEEIAITKRAQKSALSSTYRDPALIYHGLICLAQEYRRAIQYGEYSTHGGVRNLQRELRIKLDQLHLEDRASINPRRASRFGKEYFANYEGKDFFLDKHLAKGTSRDPKNCLRIYYTYDDESEKIIIGHLPSHLSNTLT